MNLSLRIHLITPLFSRGAYEDRPEIRPASIRGQLHWWFRALGGSFSEERAIFGGIANKNFHLKDQASRIVVRISDIQGNQGRADTLPHKIQPHKRAPKACFPPGTEFLLHLSTRRKPLDASQSSNFNSALKAWLLLGSLGNRSTRGGGSVQCFNPPFPQTESGWEKQVRLLINDSALRAAILPETFTNEKSARFVVTDTLGGPSRERAEQNDLTNRLNDPLGVVVFGRRKTSPLRFRLYKFESGLKIIAVWDGRPEVTGNNESHLRGVIELLRKKGKPIGELLSKSSLLPVH